MKPLYFSLFLLLSLPALGQQWQLSSEGIISPTESETKSVLRKAVSDSLAAHQPAIADSSAVVKTALKLQRVYSEKQWRAFSDSLSKLPFVQANPLAEQLPKEVSKDELLQAIHQEFFTALRDSTADQLPQKDTAINALIPIQEKLPKGELPFPNPLPGMDLSRLKLPASSLEELTPMAATLVPAKYLSQLERVRKINVKEARFQLREKETYAQSALAKIEQKPSFRERSYFEGVIGISPGDLTILQLSPTVGYHFADYLSVGVGPNILLRREANQTNTTIGIKSFLKAELFQRRAYLQAEGIFDSFGQGTSDQHGVFQRRSLVVCAGYLLALSRSLSLNLAIGYQLTNTRSVSGPYSPWVFRTGISTIKIND